MMVRRGAFVSLLCAVQLGACGATQVTSTSQSAAGATSGQGGATTVASLSPAASTTSVFVAPTSAPTPTSTPCERAAALLARAPTLYADGRLDRAARSIQRAASLCPEHAHDADLTLLAALTALDRFTEARALAAVVEASGAPTAKAAAKAARATCDRLDKKFANTDDAKRPMRARFGEAAAALDGKDFKHAKELYSKAWELWRPNGQALYGAGLAARGLGDASEAQRFFDRAIVDFEKATSASLTFAAPNGFSPTAHAPTWAPDGRTLAIANGDSVALLDVFTWREKLRLPARSHLATALAWAPDGKRIAVGGVDGVIRIWDVAAGTLVTELAGHMAFVSGLAYGRDGATLVSGSDDMTIRVWNLAKGTGTKLVGHAAAVRAIALTSDGRWIVSASIDRTARIWPIAGGASVATLTGHTSPIEALALSADGRRLATGSLDKTVKVWTLTATPTTVTAALDRTLVGHSEWIRDVAFSRDGKSLATAADDKTIRLWDVATGAQTAALVDHTGATTGVAFQPGGALLVSTSRDGTVRLRDASTGVTQRVLEGHAAPLESLAISGDGRTLAMSARDPRVLGWASVPGAPPFRSLGGFSAPVRALTFGRDDTLFVGAQDGSTWTLPWGATAGPLTGSGPTTHVGPIESIAVHPDGRTFATGSTDMAVRVWGTATHAPFKTLLGHQGSITRIAYAPDGKHLASASYDLRIRIWDLAMDHTERELRGHVDVIGDVAYAPDGKVLVSASHDATVRLWDAASGAAIASLPQPSAATSVVFSPDGAHLYVGLADHTIAVVAFPSGVRERTIGGHDDAVMALALRADGRVLATLSRDNTVRLVRVEDGAVIVSMRALRDRDGGYAYTPSGDVEILGEVRVEGRDPLLCRIGALTFPFDLCAERFVATGLVSEALAYARPLDRDP